MLNKAILMGRLCADPEFRQTPAGTPVCRFRIAINRPKQKGGSQEADFINCTAWRGTAEFISRYFNKGSMILIEGQLRNNDYTDNNGVKHYGMEVLCENVSFCESKNAGAASQPEQYQQPASQGQYPQQQYQNAPPYPQQYQQPPQYGSVPDYRNNYPNQR